MPRRSTITFRLAVTFSLIAFRTRSTIARSLGPFSCGGSSVLALEKQVFRPRYRPKPLAVTLRNALDRPRTSPAQARQRYAGRTAYVTTRGSGTDRLPPEKDGSNRQPSASTTSATRNRNRARASVSARPR
ncbi:uncharacterized protein LOC119769753 [Culex quinquefasciatus]|uniref:uncharacterized protein LOC119769753 n=1 Tax=Culex quinquefasciatus TaxID=7176 RepID=UPI0018E3BD66|nr:uncharacterized protein LOC119769753 [Culex quinquefasciatus]